MAKTPEEKLAERLEKIKELERQRDEITRQLELLTGLREPEKPKPKPDGYVQGDEVLRIVTEAERPLSTADIVSAIRKKWDYQVAPSSVRTSGKYLAKKYPRKIAYNEGTKKFFTPSQNDPES